MNLSIFQRGNRVSTRLMFRMADRMDAGGLPDIVRMCLVHARFFGQPVMRYVHEIICGPSDWTRAERELIAAAVSRANECPFCYSGHMANAAVAAQDPSFAALGDSPDSKHRAQLTAVLPYVEKLTKDPKSVTAADAAELKAKGLTTQMIETAVHISTAFSVINRIANGFQFKELSAEGNLKGGKLMKTFGYRWVGRFGAILDRLP